MSWPKRKIRPESGWRSPMAIFNRTLLPLPAAPRTTRVSPARNRKETPSTTFRSKLRLTSSNWRIGAAAPFAGVEAMRKSEVHENACDESGEDEDPYGGNDHRLGRRPADALSAAGGFHPVETADPGDDNGEDQRFQQALHQIVGLQNLIGGRPVFRRSEAKAEISDHE